MIVIPETRRAH